MDYRSHIVPFVFQTFSSVSGVLYTNARPATFAVITFVGLVNTSSSAGDAVLIVKNQGTPTQTAFHSGFVGSGSFDRFPLTCEVPLESGDNVGYFANTGTWQIVVSGYYVPLVFTG